MDVIDIHICMRGYWEVRYERSLESERANRDSIGGFIGVIGRISLSALHFMRFGFNRWKHFQIDL